MFARVEVFALSWVPARCAAFVGRSFFFLSLSFVGCCFLWAGVCWGVVVVLLSLSQCSYFLLCVWLYFDHADIHTAALVACFACIYCACFVWLHVYILCMFCVLYISVYWYLFFVCVIVCA